MTSRRRDEQTTPPLVREEEVRIRQFLVALMLVAAPSFAFAQDDEAFAVPEPATLALLGVGVVAFIVARVNKRK